jgi:tetratricopeptide (TPR) repeat protein
MDQQSFQTATQLHEAGKLDEAEAIYREILAQDPRHADSMHLLGVAAAQRRQFASAIELIRQAIAIRPAAAQYHLNLALALRQSGELGAAAAALRQALALQPDNAAAFHQLGLILHGLGQTDDSMAALIEAARLRPDSARFQFDAGTGYLQLEQYDKTVPYYRRAVKLDPKDAHYLYNLGVALAETEAFAEALDAFQKTIELAPNAPEAHSNKGAMLNKLGRRTEAVACLRAVIESSPSFPGAYNNLGTILEDEGKWIEALEVYRKAIEREPGKALYHWNCARALMALGQWIEGWDEFEWRLKMPPAGWYCPPPQPQWDGSDPAGKTILLLSEGGYGDMLQFVRFAALVAERGAKVLLECKPELATLFDTVAGVERVIPRGQPRPPFDLHMPIQSLPRIFGITPDNVPNQVPYLTPPADRVRRWAERLAGESKRRVGLVWAGSKRSAHKEYRTETIDALAPLADVPDIRFFSLQKGDDSRQAAPPGMDLVDLSAELNDFADTAALIQNLDLVVAVDTAVGHLAGALARPVWILVPFKSDFRWLLHRPDTPWYPTMRLFRQPAEGDWRTPILRMADALRELKS